MKPERRPGGSSQRPQRRSPRGPVRGSGERDRGREPQRRQRPEGIGGDQVEGRRAVQELLAANRRPIERLFMSRSRIDEDIVELAERRNVPIRWITSEQLEEYARTDAHQGVIARSTPLEIVAISELFEQEDAFVLALDHITDPRNLGSMIRSAVQAGVTGFVVPKNRAAALTPTAVKAAAGAIEYASFATGGTASALDIAKNAGAWSIGLDAGGNADIYKLAVADQRIVLVAGSEGGGIAPLVRKRCDLIASIPMSGPLDSLNVSVATAIACFAIAHQRGEGSLA